jgi:hypothetical protein
MICRSTKSQLFLGVEDEQVVLTTVPYQWKLVPRERSLATKQDQVPFIRTRVLRPTVQLESELEVGLELGRYFDTSQYSIHASTSRDNPGATIKCKHSKYYLGYDKKTDEIVYRTTKFVWNTDEHGALGHRDGVLLMTPTKIVLGHTLVVGDHSLHVGHLSLDIFDPSEPALHMRTTNDHPNQLWTMESAYDYFVSVYKTQYRPPEWAKRSFGSDTSASATIVATIGSDEDVVRRLVTEREPTNLQGLPCYDQALLHTKMGYKRSWYHTYFTKYHTLAPNVAVYTPGHTEDGRIIHIYNAIGYAFDSIRQVDSRFFARLATAERDVTMFRLYTQLLSNIYHFARQCNFETVIMSLVGCGFFADQYPTGADDLRKLWAYAFLAVDRTGLTTKFMGQDEGLIAEMFRIHEQQPFEYVGKYAGLLDSFDDLTRSLIVNAWDPHSVPGNGNGGDDSLDGFIGRSTAIQFAGWGQSNPSLLSNEIMKCPPCVPELQMAMMRYVLYDGSETVVKTSLLDAIEQHAADRSFDDIVSLLTCIADTSIYDKRGSIQCANGKRSAQVKVVSAEKWMRFASVIGSCFTASHHPEYPSSSWDIVDFRVVPHIPLGRHITLPTKSEVVFTVKNMEIVKTCDYSFEVVLNVHLIPNPSKDTTVSHCIPLARCRKHAYVRV